MQPAALAQSLPIAERGTLPGYPTVEYHYDCGDDIVQLVVFVPGNDTVFFDWTVSPEAWSPVGPDLVTRPMQAGGESELSIEFASVLERNVATGALIATHVDVADVRASVIATSQYLRLVQSTEDPNNVLESAEFRGPIDCTLAAWQNFQSHIVGLE